MGGMYSESLIIYISISLFFTCIIGLAPPFIIRFLLLLRPTGKAPAIVITIHTVELNGFWLGMFSVTQGEWEKIMGENPSFFPYGPNFPVENVSWNAVQHFIDKLSTKSNREFCLPTEAEWEYAARSGGKRQKYAGGDDVDRVAWYMVNSGRHPHEVGTKAPNGLEIYDMSGNVDEWCRDIYDLDAYSRHSRNNPVITSGGSGHVYRGGSWHNGPRRVRTSFRDHEGPEFTNYDLGFRLCLPQSGSK